MSMRKLVRDNIPDIIRATGQKPITEVVDGDEYLAALNDKLREEVGEWLESDGDGEELADILEVMRALAEHHGMDWLQIENLRFDKAHVRGSFSKGIIWLGNR